MPVTQTPGFEAGISVMAVVLGLAIISVLAFFLRRCQRGTLYGHPGLTTRVGMAKQSELDAEKLLAASAYASEADVKPYMRPSELPAVCTPQELPAGEQERTVIESVGTYNRTRHKQTNKAFLRTAQACRLRRHRNMSWLSSTKSVRV
jgi:hypothetical protein